jgi:hypothetical protein
MGNIVMRRGGSRQSGRVNSAPVHIGWPAVGVAGRISKAINLGSKMSKHRVLACLLTLSAIVAAPTAIAQTAPDYAAIFAAPDRSDADRKLDTNRAPAQWLAFIGAKPGMKILDIFAVYG